MNCTFYRPISVNIEEFEKIVAKLNNDLHCLITREYDEKTVYNYVRHLVRNARPLEKNPRMSFLGLDDPCQMPHDARVEFFYRPTYIATAIIMRAVLSYPSLMNESDFLAPDSDFSAEIVKSTLVSCMLGCTGRSFDGAGVIKLRDCINIFEEAGASEFIEKYPHLCTEFSTLFREKQEEVKYGGDNQYDYRY